MTGPIVAGPGGAAGDIKELFSGSPTAPGITGGVFIGKPGIALPPADDIFIPATEHSPDLKNVGFVSEDGVTGTEDRSINEIAAWGGDIVAFLQESFSVSWQMVLLQIMNREIAKLAYGDDNVAYTQATQAHGNWLAIKVNKLMLPKRLSGLTASTPMAPKVSRRCGGSHRWPRCPRRAILRPPIASCRAMT